MRILLLLTLPLLISWCNSPTDNPIYRSEYQASSRVDTNVNVLEAQPTRIQRVVVHCTATQKGHKYTPEQAQRDWNRRWTDGIPGYHYMIALDGTVHRLREVDCDEVINSWEIAYGAAGFNSTSVHISYVGGVTRENGQWKPTDTRTPEQRRSMTEVLIHLLSRYPWVQIEGHGDLPGVHKACPSFRVCEWIRHTPIIDITNRDTLPH